MPVRQAGVRVDEDTALQFSAVFRAVAYISQTLAWLSWHVYHDVGDGNKKLMTSTPAARILRGPPNKEMGSFTFRETMVAWALLWGNAYAEIERDVVGRPVALWPISPDRVTPKRDEGGELYYEVYSQTTGAVEPVPAADIYHLHGLGFDGLTGYSVVSMAARSIGIGIASDEFSASFMANGAFGSGVITHPGKLSDTAKDRLQDDWKNKYGGPSNAGRTPVLEEGMAWQAMTMPLKDAQLLESRKFQVNEIARWFGLPPHKLADLERATFSNIEHQSMEVVNDALMPWVVRLEQEADRKLISAAGRNSLYTKINVMSLLRGDNKSRAEFYKFMREIGVYSTNDIRRLEDMPPVGPEGDKLIVPMNFTTIERVGEEDESKQAPPGDEAPPQDAFRLVFEDAAGRIARREAARAKDAARRYRDSREDFASWMDRFFGQHRAQLVEALTPPARSLYGGLLGADNAEGAIDVVRDYAAEHIVDARALMVGLYDGDTTADEIGGIDRAERIADAVIDQITRAAAIREVIHGNTA